jgi:hypothetical protein
MRAGPWKLSARSIRGAKLVEEMLKSRRGYRTVYRVRETWSEVRRRGVNDAGRDRVARLMCAQDAHGVGRS